MSTPNGTADGSGAAQSRLPRLLVIGAGSRGHAYARAIQRLGTGTIAAVAEPVDSKRAEFGRTYIWNKKNAAGPPKEGQSFRDWQEYVAWERARRQRRESGRGREAEVAAAAAAAAGSGSEIDAALVCTLDETHAEIVVALAPLGLHILCEKPLATTLDDCCRIYDALLRAGAEAGAEAGAGTATATATRDAAKEPSAVFAIGHVLRYSPHNVLLRRLLLEEKAIGDIVSVEHTEPVGWWHFAHSYVRGHWRKESTSAPSLLTKSCHDIDLLLWLLCSPAPEAGRHTAHLPSSITSTGSLVYFRRRHKPERAGAATNCLSCPAEPVCMYSAKKIYQSALRQGNTGWPVKIVLPEVEDCLDRGGLGAAETALLARLAEDYDESTPEDEKLRRPWFGRCVYEAGNDVCDDQFVTLTWHDDDDDDDNSSDNSSGAGKTERRQQQHRNAKRAVLHMVAFTEKICERRTRVYGTRGEIEADSSVICVHDFASVQTRTYRPPVPEGGHGGGDEGLARQFLRAVDAVKNDGCSVREAQETHIGCSLEEVIRSHAMVFAAEQARCGECVVDWPQWWHANVEGKLSRKAELGAGTGWGGGGEGQVVTNNVSAASVS